MRLSERLQVCLMAASVLCAAPARAGDIHFRGLLDLVAAERSEAYDLNTFTRGDNPFDAYGVRLFADGTVNDRLQVFTQLVLRDATGPYVDGAYLMFTPRPATDLHVLAGKIPSAIGTWAPHTYSNKNPLVSTPLMYQYHTSLLWFEVVPSADVLLAAAGTGQEGVDYFGFPEGGGMTLVDDSYWDVGVTVTGSQRPFEYAAGVTAGTPGWGSTSKDENSGKSVLGRVGASPLPWLRFGVSGAYGPYLIQELNSLMPPGKSVNDYRQKLGMADLELESGHFEVRSEGVRGAWETPTVGELSFTSGYVELKYSLSFGAFVAGRWDALRFGDITDSAGASRSWDADVTRWEVGAGYRFNRDVVAKVVRQEDRIDASEEYPSARRSSLVAAQLSVGF